MSFVTKTVTSFSKLPDATVLGISGGVSVVSLLVGCFFTWQAHEGWKGMQRYLALANIIGSLVGMSLLGFFYFTKRQSQVQHEKDPIIDLTEGDNVNEAKFKKTALIVACVQGGLLLVLLGWSVIALALSKRTTKATTATSGSGNTPAGKEKKRRAKKDGDKATKTTATTSDSENIRTGKGKKTAKKDGDEEESDSDESGTEDDDEKRKNDEKKPLSRTKSITDMGGVSTILNASTDLKQQLLAKTKTKHQIQQDRELKEAEEKKQEAQEKKQQELKQQEAAAETKRLDDKKRAELKSKKDAEEAKLRELREKARSEGEQTLISNINLNPDLLKTYLNTKNVTSTNANLSAPGISDSKSTGGNNDIENDWTEVDDDDDS